MSPDSIALCVKFYMFGEVSVGNSNIDAYCGDDCEKLFTGQSLTSDVGRNRPGHKSERTNHGWQNRVIIPAKIHLLQTPGTKPQHDGYQGQNGQEGRHSDHLARRLSHGDRYLRRFSFAKGEQRPKLFEINESINNEVWHTSKNFGLVQDSPGYGVTTQEGKCGEKRLKDRTVSLWCPQWYF